MIRAALLTIVISGCGFPRPADVPASLAIGGTVHGMWTGADGVALRLTANDVDTLYTVTSDGPFSFPAGLDEGVSYVATIAANPTRHTCSIASGANGVVGSTNVTSIDVACVGPMVSIVLSSPEAWTFD